VDQNEVIVSNPALYADYIVHVVTPTDTPTNTPTNTPSDTPTDTPTYTPTYTPTFTYTPTDTPTDTPTNTPTYTPTNTPTVTPTKTPSLNAYAHLEPEGPQTVLVGSRITLDLFVNSGGNDVSVAQHYLTFTNSILQNVDAGASGCVV